MNGIDRVMALRADIIQRSDSLRQVLGAAEPATDGFGARLEQAMHAVSDQQATASSMATAFERGEINDLAEVMIERQKSSLAFQTVLQTRNKLLGAYRDIMNMPV